MAIALNTTIAPAQAPARPAVVLPFPRDYRDAIRAGRKPLPSHDLQDVPLRRFVASACQAEVDHAHRDFRQVVAALNFGGFFYDDPDAHAAFRFSHEAKAGAALMWLAALQSHDNDRHGASIVRDYLERWNRWSRADKAEWLQRHRTLLRGLIKAANAYRAARAIAN
jgi:hypothetical protein